MLHPYDSATAAMLTQGSPWDANAGDGLGQPVSVMQEFAVSATGPDRRLLRSVSRFELSGMCRRARPGQWGDLARWAAGSRLCSIEGLRVSNHAELVSWLDRGACRSEDPELFFPETGRAPGFLQLARAKAVCRQCSVQQQCLAYALDTRQAHGIWGGMSEDERRALRSPARASAGSREWRNTGPPLASRADR
jgi:WhiB family transcriptional regulator, redox-sensing transcriptional regulator